MKKFFLYIIMCLPLLVGCSEKSYFIEGTSSQFVLGGGTAYIRNSGLTVPGTGLWTLDSGHTPAIDSCQVVHGHFQMSGPLDDDLFVMLCMGDNSLFPFVLENGEININIARTSVQVNGTPLNDRLYQFLASRDSLMYALSDLPRSEALLMLDGYSPFDIQDYLFRKQTEYKNALEKLETEFVKDNYKNVLGQNWFLNLCSQAVGYYGRPVATPQIESLYRKAPKSFRNIPQIKDYMQRASRSY